VASRESTCIISSTAYVVKLSLLLKPITVMYVPCQDSIRYHNYVRGKGFRFRGNLLVNDSSQSLLHSEQHNCYNYASTVAHVHTCKHLFMRRPESFVKQQTGRMTVHCWTPRPCNGTKSV